MTQKPESLAEWLVFFEHADIPVLRHTAIELKKMQADPRRLNASDVANVVTDDPLMTVKLMRYMQARKSRHQTQEILDVKQMLLMTGLENFFTAVPADPIAEDQLKDHPDALANFSRVVRRARLAAYYSVDWAQRIHNIHSEEVKVSALLTHVAEILMWCYNPVPMLEIRGLQDLHKSMRSRKAQEQVLGFSGVDLQRKITLEWNLPNLLLGFMDPTQASLSQVRNVKLAVRLARHCESGWHDAAIPDDIREIAELLNMDPGKVLTLVKSVPASVFD